MELRRFKYTTDDKEVQARIDALIPEKGLSRKDLMLLLWGLEINYDAFPILIPGCSSAHPENRPHVSRLISLCE